MKKRILSISLAIIAFVGFTTISGCKKGENDPFLSLKSRKARISGEWKLSGGTVTETSSNGGLSNTDVTTFTGSTITSGNYTATYTETLTIDKDGTFEVTIVEDGDLASVRGNWFFAGKNKDIELKNKEAIVFSELVYVNPSSTSTYTGIYADQIILIDQLKKKEIIFKGTYTYSDTDGNSGSNTYDRTFEKK